VTVRGTNKKAKKLRGLHDPEPKKLFVSGLPFEVKPADVSIIFQSCGKVVSVKLIKFGDTGRCNGQAYVTFDTDKAAEEALKLSGTMIDNEPSDDSKKKGKKSAEGAKRKELKLKVSKAVNRHVSKKS
jgi:RNA recognition motif-containing protein